MGESHCSFETKGNRATAACTHLARLQPGASLRPDRYHVSPRTRAPCRPT
jgi:hypothetical protein